MADIMMKCGCSANATSDGHPSCVIHLTTEVANDQPDLTGRTARCSCGNTQPSSMSLAFFSYQGPGSADSMDTCKCGYAACAHDKKSMKRIRPRDGLTVIEQGKCKGFEARGPLEFDRYYCGCRGWD